MIKDDSTIIIETVPTNQQTHNQHVNLIFIPLTVSQPHSIMYANVTGKFNNIKLAHKLLQWINKCI
jgi:hypothetical protein